LDILVDATSAGSGNLEIVINGGRVACRVQETSPRHFLAEFTPVQEMKHTVEMRLATNKNNAQNAQNAKFLIFPALMGNMFGTRLGSFPWLAAALLPPARHLKDGRGRRK
jgi:hypothetical protein